MGKCYAFLLLTSTYPVIYFHPWLRAQRPWRVSWKIDFKWLGITGVIPGYGYCPYCRVLTHVSACGLADTCPFMITHLFEAIRGRTHGFVPTGYVLLVQEEHIRIFSYVVTSFCPWGLVKKMGRARALPICIWKPPEKPVGYSPVNILPIIQNMNTCLHMLPLIIISICKHTRYN